MEEDEDTEEITAADEAPTTTEEAPHDASPTTPIEADDAATEQDDAATEEETEEPSSLPPVVVLTLEEQIAATLSSSADTTFGRGSRGSYQNARENIRDTKARSQRRLGRSALEKKNAREKIAKMEAKLAEERKRVEDDLEDKITETQRKLDEEVQSIISSLQAEIDLETDREAQILSLIASLTTSIDTKAAEISSEETITADMKIVRAKVKPGSIASQIDTVLEQKTKVTAIEKALVQDLRDCVAEMETIKVQAKSRATSMVDALQGFVTPVAKDNTDSYSWSDIERMEEVLDVAVEDALEGEKNVMAVRDRINEALLNKSAVLGEPVPATLIEVAKMRKKEKSREAELQRQVREQQQENSGSSDTGSDIELVQPAPSFKDLENQSESELLGLLSKAAGGAALSGGKTAIYGLKTVLDTLTGNQVGEATNSALEKSSGIAKGISGISTSVRETSKKGVPTDVSLAKDRIGDIIQSEGVKDTLKSTGETLGALGNVAGEFAGNLKGTESSKQAGRSAKETGKNLMSVLNAAAVLGMKQVDKIKEKASRPN